jgi:hypothetical protein
MDFHLDESASAQFAGNMRRLHGFPRVARAGSVRHDGQVFYFKQWGQQIIGRHFDVYSAQSHRYHPGARGFDGRDHCGGIGKFTGPQDKT